MTGLEIGKILEEITPLRVVWAGLGIVTVCLFLMLVTRWGDSKPVFKCLVLSLLAHCVLALYGTTVVVVLASEAREEEVFNLQRIDLAEPGAETPAPETSPERLLDSFVHRAEIEPSPVDLPRPEADSEAAPVRRRDENETPLADRSPNVEVPLESPERPRPGQATRSDAEPQRIVVSNILEPDAGTVEARQPAETPLPGPLETQVRPSEEAPETAPSRSTQETPLPVTERPTLQLPRAEAGPQVVPEAVLEDKRDVPARRGDPVRPAPLAEGPEMMGNDLGENDAPAPRPSFAASPSLRQRPGLEQRGDEPIERSRPSPGALELPKPDSKASSPSGGIPSGPVLSARTPSTPHRSDEALRFHKPSDRAATYRFRTSPNRSQLAVERGGSKASERAVEDGLAWLAAHQSPDGNWDADGFQRQCPEDDPCGGPAGFEEQVDGHDRESVGGQADTGLTGLALLAYLGAGYTHQDGRHAETLQRALDWLVAGQDKGGSLAGQAASYAHLYCHAMATIAVCEAYGMTGDSSLRGPAEAAIEYIIAAQHPTQGGWRYESRQLGDTSSTGWQIMALKSADLAGIDVPRKTYNLAHRFLDSVASGEFGGLASYRKGEVVKESMTAEALFARQLLGLDRENAANNEAGDYLLGHLPGEEGHNLYYWYYGTLTMYQLGGRYWQGWNDSLRDLLVRRQRRRTHALGSWDPRRPWGGHGGRIYSTALSVLCLEVYYRFLPLYRTSGQIDEARATSRKNVRFSPK